MTETALPLVPDVPDDVTELTAGFPKFERLDPEAALQACDGHANSGVNAVVFILLASGSELLLCGNCARKHFSYEHTATAPTEDRAKGSEH